MIAAQNTKLNQDQFKLIYLIQTRLSSPSNAAIQL